MLEGLIPSGLRIKKRPAINTIADTFEEQWNFFLKKLVQLLLKESKRIVNKIKIQIEIELAMIIQQTEAQNVSNLKKSI